MALFKEILLFIAVAAGMILIIPLCVWGGSGSLQQAWEATKRFLLIMAFIFGGGLILAGIILLSGLGAS